MLRYRYRTVIIKNRAPMKCQKLNKGFLGWAVSTISNNWLALILVIIWVLPPDQFTMTESILVVVPRPTCAMTEFWEIWLDPPPSISLMNFLPFAITVTLEPIPLLSACTPFKAIFNQFPVAMSFLNKPLCLEIDID